jgi:hypothetical protein
MATEEVLEGYTNFSISIQTDLLALLDRIAAEKKLNRSQFVRQCFGLYLHDLAQKFNPPLCGEVVDANGVLISSGLVSDDLKARIASGELKMRLLIK